MIYYWMRLFLPLVFIVLTCSAKKKEEVVESVPRFIILIDPGHGGVELGAHSSSPVAYKEKELALSTARYLQSDLEHLGHQVFLTRERDETCTLKQRVALANKKAIDLFVSVHYNSAPSVQASGIEVFFYKKTNDLRSLHSERLAEYVLKGVIDKTMALSRGVKHGDFAVIRETKIPAILVEGGFLTNQEELQKVLSRNYQRKIARGIALGIEHFLADERVKLLSPVDNNSL